MQGKINPGPATEKDWSPFPCTESEAAQEGPADHNALLGWWIFKSSKMQGGARPFNAFKNKQRLKLYPKLTQEPVQRGKDGSVHIHVCYLISERGSFVQDPNER